MDTGASGGAASGAGTPAFDIEAIRAKYRDERDKRLRKEGREQYRYLDASLDHLVADPNADPDFTRAPLDVDIEILVIGGGFSGLSTSAQLRKAGIDDFLILEKGADFGGTWYWNRYPGAMCDTDAYVYLPLLEETGYIPSQKYILGSEILEHAQRIGRHFDLYPKALFQTEAADLRWDDDANLWHVSTSRGDSIRARFVVQTIGVLDRPKLPGIPGVTRFKGHMFHTCRWDYGYTGGDINGNLTGLAGKRVAIIGTGCTSIQCIPHLAASAGHLYVFQRTPSSVDERRNRPTDPEWVKSLQPGWHRVRRENFVALTSGMPQEEDLVSDGWTETVRSIGGFFGLQTDEEGETPSPEALALRMEIADARNMDRIRARIDSIVKDPATAEALKPWFRQYCKRPTFSDDYLPTFNRDNVTLVDTDGRGVSGIDETSVIVDGVAYEVDCIIFASGFEVGTDVARRTGTNVYGRGGLTLSEHWRGGFKTFHGFYSHGFPNLFHTGNNQNGVAYVVTYPTDEQAEHIAAMLDHARKQGIVRIEPRAEAVADWVSTIRAMSVQMLEFQSQCTPGYHNNEGKLGDFGGLIDEAYGGGALEFARIVRQWREGPMNELEFRAG